MFVAHLQILQVRSNNSFNVGHRCRKKKILLQSSENRRFTLECERDSFACWIQKYLNSTLYFTFAGCFYHDISIFTIISRRMENARLLSTAAISNTSAKGNLLRESDVKTWWTEVRCTQLRKSRKRNHFRCIWSYCIDRYACQSTPLAIMKTNTWSKTQWNIPRPFPFSTSRSAMW